MRTVLILIVSLAIIALGFGVYWTLDRPELPAVAGKTKPSATQPATLPTEGAQFIGPAENVWYIHYDARTGRPSSRVRAQRYEPQADGRVRVLKPEAEFFSYEDNDLSQVLRLVGESGYLTMQETITRSSRELPANTPPSQSPRSGDLTDVTLYVLDDLEMPVEQASLTLTMPNASFDNELFRISTEAYRDERGKLIPRDQVPVKVRGDYEFDGRGLTIIYNQQYGRIDRLEIAHGQRLLIKNPAQFMKGDAARRGRTPKAMGWEMDLPMPGILLAAADPATAIAAAASAAPADAPRPKPARTPAARQPDPNLQTPVYRALFRKNVRVLQGGEQVASGEEMQIDFLQEEKPEAATTQPVMLAIAPILAAAPAQSVPARTAAPAAAEAKAAPATRPARRGPTTQPLGEEPIEVLWEGPLVVVPIVGVRPERIAPGEAIVKFTGSSARPVRMTRIEEDVRTTITCGTLTHWTLDQGALLEDTDGVPVHMIDSRGTDIRTRRMVFSDANGTAQLFGVSSAKMPLDDPGQDGKPQFMDVTWTQHCTLHFDPSSEQAMTISAADLLGEVNVKHPELSLKAESLNLKFDTEREAAARPAAKAEAANADVVPADQPSQKAPPLRQLEARGNVYCEVNGPGGDADRRSIKSNALTLMTAHTPEGKLYARNLHAFGAVEATDPERTLHAGVLTATLAEPAERPAKADPANADAAARPAKVDVAPGELQSLVAQDNVRIITTDGKTATADSLSIQKRDARTTVALHGRPAKVMREKDSLSGEQITMIPETQELLVIGPGRLDGIQQDAPDQPERPMELTWKRSLVGRGETMEAEGSVYVKSIDADGSINIAQGERMVVVTTRPATAEPAGAAAVAQADPNAAKPAPTTRPTGELDVLSNRVVQSLHLIGSARTTSTLLNENEELMRMFHVDSHEMRYHRRSVEDQEFLIPGAGRLLFVDDRPPDETPEAKAAAEDPMSLRGTTVFVWKEQLLYKEKDNQITMTGNVRIVREDVDPKGPDRLDVYGDKLIADLVPPAPASPDGAAAQPAAPVAPAAPATPATRPAFGLGGDLSTKMQLKHVRVIGNVHVVSDKLNVEAASIDYAPATSTMILRGTPGQPVTQRDQRGAPVATFEEMTWNTKTSRIVATKIRGTPTK